MTTRPHRPVSLTLRITAFVGTATTLVFLAFGWMIERSIENHFAEQDADELQVVADAVQRALISFSQSPRTTLPDNLAKAISGHHGIFFYVADVTGQTLYTSAGPNLAVLAKRVAATNRIDMASLHVWQEPPNTYRGSVLKIKVDRDYTVAVATIMNFHLHFLQQFRHSLWLTTFAASVISILAAWLAVHQGHAPLREISNRIRSIHSDQLHQRLPLQHVPHELLILAKAFNAMLDSIEDSFQRLSNFSADIAHELRTPVTNLTTQTQVALSKARSTEEYREILYSNLEEFERMSKMISDMLFLAQTDNKLLKPEWVKINLAAEVQALFDYFEAWAEERGVVLIWQGDSPVVEGDRLMLRRALSNLFSNAIRHTPQGQAVTVTLMEEPYRAVIRVTNPGIDIPGEHLSKLFDRFYRIDPSRQRKGDGAGLGLAIVKSIVDAHVGTITVTAENGRITFQISLPLTASI
jgi:two-component system heavy metal sensor histidine kinase CusS